MKKNHFWLGLGGTIATVMLLAGVSSANDSSFGESFDPLVRNDLFRSCMTVLEKDCKTWASRGGGGEMPRFMPGDTKVELANGEKYSLKGTIEVRATGPFLRIDLKAQPWLATTARVKSPYYRLTSGSINWNRFRGQRVIVLGTAHYAIYSDRTRTRVDVYFEPSSDPILATDPYR
jgi:hypothetical protein